MNPLLIAAGAGALGLGIYAVMKHGPSAIDATAANATTSPGTIPVPVTVPGPAGPQTTVVNVPITTTPPPQKAPPPPAFSPDVAPPITTLPTASEQSRTLRVVAPAKQPKMPSVQNEAKARSLAPSLSAALVANANGAEYAKKDTGLLKSVQAFQSAVGLVADGLYGPQTAGALAYFLGGNPPPPYFWGTGERVVKVYLPIP
jgi:peptidoglycan hydrolase-like protein with peptidoglycan-binding domain